ncbi:ribose 5-phosphate isomerase B [Helicobacter trogontum]|uniref:Ribose 5-phosphate isomerase B n=1 Tax=Helicobacter trogontum TaxID=50960 RepID=A0A4U8SC95_9HELI|nr:ribose 5-phosphate isomerase B [Helicobacter trogontum]TLD83631.1 ribose 5-phosphate isomerase B [Helicobacter trogontum]
MIFIASDHAGLNIKRVATKYCKEHNIEFKDLGVHVSDSVDYPDMAETLCQEMLKDIDNSIGILICGSGIGMSIAANRHRAIRAALCFDPYTAAVARKHNNANVLCLGERVIGAGVAEAVIEVFLNEAFEGDRHIIRVEKLTNIKD